MEEVGGSSGSLYLAIVFPCQILIAEALIKKLAIALPLGRTIPIADGSRAKGNFKIGDSPPFREDHPDR